jgi:sugar phosphate isomerase/epimerase
MNNALFGYTGFVGSNIMKYYPIEYFYNSTNYKDAVGKSFDTVFFCGLPATKWLINKNPEMDTQTINNISWVINTIKAKRFILISTIDVYTHVDNCDNETATFTPKLNHTYGRNRYIFEQFIRVNFKDSNTLIHIIRLPGLFGMGLKKNIIYDLLNDNNIENINKCDSFQWYDLDWLKNDIDRCINDNIQTINLFTEPLSNNEITQLFSNKYNESIFKNDANNSKHYNLTTIYGCNGSKYIRTKNEVIESLKNFICNQTTKKNCNIAVSNICLNKVNKLQFYSLLKLYGIKNIEIAPTKIEDWQTFPSTFVNELNVIKSFGLNVSSFQSIMYNMPLYNIFNILDHEPFLAHMERIISIACYYNIKIIVFGCPKNRLISNISNENYNIENGILFFKKMGDICNNNGNVKICLENNSKLYGCDFLNTVDEVSEFVKKINHKNIKMMVDIGNMIMENDTSQIKEYKDNIYHIHISNIHMNNLLDDNYDKIKDMLNIIQCACENNDVIYSLEFLNNKNEETELFALNETLIKLCKLFD